MLMHMVPYNHDVVSTYTAYPRMVHHHKQHTDEHENLVIPGTAIQSFQ